MMIKRRTVFKYRSNTSKIETVNITSRNFGALKQYKKNICLLLFLITSQIIMTIQLKGAGYTCSYP